MLSGRSGGPAGDLAPGAHVTGTQDRREAGSHRQEAGSSQAG